MWKRENWRRRQKGFTHPSTVHWGGKCLSINVGSSPHGSVPKSFVGQKILRNNLTVAFCGWRHKGRPWWAFKETGAEGRTTIMRKRNIVVCRLLEIKCTIFLLSSDLMNSEADGDIACRNLFDNVQTYILSPVLYCHMPVYHMSAQLHWTHTSELNLVIILT